jgi:Uma2 family endonuclease
MASRLQVAPADYLSTSFDNPDREYVRGEIVERSTPDRLHALAQVWLIHYFCAFIESHKLFPYSEMRMRLASDLFRIPDVVVFADTDSTELVPSQPPFLVIEILSPDDRYSYIHQKLAEYRIWGVPHIWVVDPHRRTLDSYESGALSRVDALKLPGYPVEITADLFSC